MRRNFLSIWHHRAVSKTRVRHFVSSSTTGFSILRHDHDCPLSISRKCWARQVNELSYVTPSGMRLSNIGWSAQPARPQHVPKLPVLSTVDLRKLMNCVWCQHLTSVGQQATQHQRGLIIQVLYRSYENDLWQLKLTNHLSIAEILCSLQ